jgi:uncharacterized membrane protein YgcG
MNKNIVLSICLAGFLLLGSLNGPVLALTFDQLAVIDDAGIFEDRIEDVEQAVDELVTYGADVRVRTVMSYGDAGNLDRYELQIEENSPSWTSPEGSRKNNLVGIIIAFAERETGLYYGSYWEDVLGDSWLAIQSEIMNPYFREGEYATGTIKGLQEIQRLIEENGQVQPPPQASATGWWIGLIVVAVVAGVIIWLLWRRSRKQVKAARQKALLAKQGAAAGINELNERLQMLEIKVNIMGRGQPLLRQRASAGSLRRSNYYPHKAPSAIASWHIAPVTRKTPGWVKRNLRIFKLNTIRYWKNWVRPIRYLAVLRGRQNPFCA